MTLRRRAPVAWEWLAAACVAMALSGTGCATNDPTPSDADGAGASEGDQAAPLSCDPGDLSSVYERRIAPLLTDEHPSTCNECHLAGIDLSIYVQADPCQTMACLVDQGLVDLDAPDQSVLLSWVARAKPAGLITQAVIDTEYAGVREWIGTAAVCGDAECPEYDDPCGAGPAVDECDLTVPEMAGEFQDPGGCDDLAIEQLWYDSVYRWRGRCYPCHFDGEGNADAFDAPRWIVPGKCGEGSLLSLRRVQATGLLDVDDPASSPLLLKPLEEELGGVEHGGGPKIHTLDDAMYVDLLRFAERYSECSGE